jgi:ATP-dependent Lon protease
VAISAALMSLFRRTAIHQNLAMTGEVTLTGRILPVGGIREKILAARRAGIRTVLIPRHNEKDLIELPDDVKEDSTFQLVDTLDDVVPLLFPTKAHSSKKGKPARPHPKLIEKPRILPPLAPPPPAEPPIKPARRPRLD